MLSLCDSPTPFSNYRDLYPVLVKMVSSLSHLVSRSQENESAFELSVQRATAMVTVLTQVTQTAGCRAELQAQLSGYGHLLVSLFFFLFFPTFVQLALIIHGVPLPESLQVRKTGDVPSYGFRAGGGLIWRLCKAHQGHACPPTASVGFTTKLGTV